MVGRVILTPEYLFQSLACLSGIADAQSGTGAVFPPSTSVFPCHYHSTIAPYSFLTNTTLTKERRETGDTLS
jgi:hypothetical protein